MYRAVDRHTRVFIFPYSQNTTAPAPPPTTTPTPPTLSTVSLGLFLCEEANVCKKECEECCYKKLFSISDNQRARCTLCILYTPRGQFFPLNTYTLGWVDFFYIFNKSIQEICCIPLKSKENDFFDPVTASPLVPPFWVINYIISSNIDPPYYTPLIPAYRLHAKW
jgi:hypothetical protein